MARQAYTGPLGVVNPEAAAGTKAVKKPPSIPAQAPGGLCFFKYRMICYGEINDPEITPHE